MNRSLLACLLLFSVRGYAETPATGLVLEHGWEDLAAWDGDTVQTVSRRTGELPKAFNWRDHFILSPVKNQGSCGSCMTFSVLGVVEGIHRIAYPLLYDPASFGGDARLDLAEQTLVSTCSKGGDCGGGYYSHFDYVRDRGVPYEKDDPYLARNSSCKNPEGKVKIESWKYVGSKGSHPSVAEIKAALYEYGPLSVTINGAACNSRGVFTSCGSTSQNHAVTLEGWVDDEKYDEFGGGYWVIRNSWGVKAGNDGFVHIVYRRKGTDQPCSGAVQVAAYAVLPGMKSLRTHLEGEPN